jgi:hypothetical protein
LGLARITGFGGRLRKGGSSDIGDEVRTLDAVVSRVGFREFRVVADQIRVLTCFVGLGRAGEAPGSASATATP